MLLRSMHRLRNLAASGIAPGSVYEWRPGERARALETGPVRQPPAPAREPAADPRMEPAVAGPQPVES
jgi:hypothetical protein